MQGYADHAGAGNAGNAEEEWPPHAEGESAMQGGWRKRFSFLFLWSPET